MSGSRIGIIACCMAMIVLSCDRTSSTQPGHAVPGGNAERGSRLLSQYGCGSCHGIPGIRGANGTVGPPLQHFDKRIYVAGVLPNQLESLMTWVMHPQQVVPGNAMPDMHVTSRDALDIAAYLYSLK